MLLRLYFHSIISYKCHAMTISLTSYSCVVIEKSDISEKVSNNNTNQHLLRIIFSYDKCEWIDSVFHLIEYANKPWFIWIICGFTVAHKISVCLHKPNVDNTNMIRDNRSTPTNTSIWNAKYSEIPLCGPLF